MIEHPGCRRVPARGDVGAGLLVQPPPRKPKLGRYGQGLFVHDAVRLEQRVHVTGSAPGIVGKGHGRTAEHIEVREDPRLASRSPRRRKASSMPALSSSGEGSLTPR